MFRWKCLEKSMHCEYDIFNTNSFYKMLMFGNSIYILAKITKSAVRVNTKSKIEVVCRITPGDDGATPR